MKILLLGKTGLLGSEFREILTKEYYDLLAPNHKELDILNFSKVDTFFNTNKIDLIINCISYTNVDMAEKENEKCFDLNVNALKNLLKYNIPIINFSSDYVFDAKKEDKITEYFPRNPLNYYGKTKLEDEKLLENYAKKWWNIRTSWLFGKNGKNFISTILEKAKTEKTLKIVNDEIGRPTYARDLAEFVVTEFIKQKPPCGHYHIQNTGEPVSWANLARFVLNNSPLIKGGRGICKITEILTKKLNRPAKRPSNSVLINTKLNNNLRNWKDAIKEFLK